MAFINRSSNKFWCLFLILCITKVCHGQLMCYVCENCPEVNSETPQFECNEEYFNMASTTDSTIQTTTEGITEEDETTTETTTTTEMSISTEESSTTTEETTTESTTEYTTESTETETTTEEPTTLTTETITTTESTTTAEPQPPTPPTIGPPPTTTVIPTPPNPGVIQSIDDVEKLNSLPEAHDEHVGDDEVDSIAIESASTKAYQPSAAFRIRQVRAIADTYHCYKVQAFNSNGTMITTRGCSRVATMESVCGQWQEQNPTEKLDRCYPCSTTKCNGSTALNVSVTAMIVALVAVFMHRK